MKFDAILIGRNEGARLPRALAAMQNQAGLRRLVYVDSGSHDNSVQSARAMGAEVVQLDPARPFTAARGRNEGFQFLAGDHAEFTLFMDGDCIVEPTWPSVAMDFLTKNPQAGLVHGYSQEEHPEASAYNLMTDLEWRKPVGPASKGIGVFVIRSDLFVAANGMRETMIAAEDDEFFFRIRALRWETWCIDALMCSHDVKLHSFLPWYRRAIRAGHSFEELSQLHKGAATAQRLRALFWAGLLPLLALAALIVAPIGVVAISALYVVSFLRLSWRLWRQGMRGRRVIQLAGLFLATKFANLYGMALYWMRRLRRKRAHIIEYK